MTNHGNPPVSKPTSTHPQRPFAPVMTPATSSSPTTSVQMIRPGPGDTTELLMVKSTSPSVCSAVGHYKRAANGVSPQLRGASAYLKKQVTVR